MTEPKHCTAWLVAMAIASYSNSVTCHLPQFLQRGCRIVSEARQNPICRSGREFRHHRECGILASVFARAAATIFWLRTRAKLLRR